MITLKLGIIGLQSADISRVRILLRLLKGSPNFQWVYAADGPFDAVLIAQGVATYTGGVRIEVLPSDGEATNGALLLPIEAQALEEVLCKLQTQLQPTVFGEFFEIPSVMSKSAEMHVTVPEVPAQKLSTLDDTAEYRLKRWPPQLVLRDSKDRIRIANLISRNSFSVEQIVQSTGVSKTEVQSFIAVLQSFGIVSVAETALEQFKASLNHNTSAAQSQVQTKWGLFSAIRRTLGI